MRYSFLSGIWIDWGSLQFLFPLLSAFFRFLRFSAFPSLATIWFMTAAFFWNPQQFFIASLISHYSIARSWKLPWNAALQYSYFPDNDSSWSCSCSEYTIYWSYFQEASNPFWIGSLENGLSYSQRAQHPAF